MTVAGLLAYALAEIFALPQGYWAVFSAIIITQASVGGSVRATADRLIGTIGGALAGAVVAWGSAAYLRWDLPLSSCNRISRISAIGWPIAPALTSVLKAIARAKLAS